MDSQLYTERIYRAYHKHYIAIPYGHYDKILKQDEGVDYFDETQMKKGSNIVLQLLEEEMKASKSAEKS